PPPTLPALPEHPAASIHPGTLLAVRAAILRRIPSTTSFAGYERREQNYEAQQRGDFSGGVGPGDGEDLWVRRHGSTRARRHPRFGPAARRDHDRRGADRGR